MNAICKPFQLVFPVVYAWEANMCSLWGVCNETWPHLWSIPILDVIPAPPSSPPPCQSQAWLTEAKSSKATISFVYL